MPSRFPAAHELIQTFAFALLAAFGGLMGYTMRTLDQGKTLTYGRALLESASAGFVGALVTMMCLALDLNPLWSGVIVGVCGWLGATASIRFLEGIIFKRLGLTRDDIAAVNEAHHANDTHP